MLEELALALALSMDGLFAGLAYGMRRIRLPLVSLAVVGLCTAGCMAFSLWAGDLVRGVVSEGRVRGLGAALLAGTGVWQMWRGGMEYLRRQAGGRPDRALRWRVGDMAVVIQVLRRPALADADASGTIEVKEALVLGTALGLDALAAGFAAASGGLGAPFLVPAVAIAQTLFIALGRALAERGCGELDGRGLLLPGAILVILAFARL